MMADGYLQVTTAIPSQAAAGLLARRVVESRLAAAVQVVGPIRSAYWWRGEIQDATEWLCIAKTTDSHFHELAALIAGQHPYEVPEITATPISHGSPDYLMWIGQEVSGSGSGVAMPRGR